MAIASALLQGRILGLAACLWRWAVTVLLLGLAAPGASAEGGEAAPKTAKDYLSELDFPGLHILERLDGAWQLYPRGQSPDMADQMPPKPLKDAWASMKQARKALEDALEIPEREPYQNDWAIFDAQGHRLTSLEELRARHVAFVIELGVWMWPAVRVGFVHVAEGVDGDQPKRLRTLSLRPVVFEVENFIRPDECDEVQRLGEGVGLVNSLGQMQSLDLERGIEDAEFRTSKQAWLGNSESPTVETLDERTSNLTRVPADHNEPVQVLRYGQGNYYHAHMDWSELELYPDQKAQWLRNHFGHQDRLATVFWYLNDVSVGGETLFPKHGQRICPTYQQRTCPGANDPVMSSCEKGLKVRPKRGSVVMWYNYHPSGRGDRNALHAGCPVGEGLVKWSGNKWVNIKPLYSGDPRWMKDHPALKRYGWKGKKKKDPNQCQIDFNNEVEEELTVLWIDPSSGEGAEVSTLGALGNAGLQSQRGHRFKLQRSGGQETNTVECKPPRSTFFLGKDFQLRRQERRKRKKKAEL